MSHDSNESISGMELLRALAGNGSRAGGDSIIRVILQGANLLLLVLSAACSVVMLVVGLFGALWVLDDRAEVRAQLRERRDGENAIRAYINTGVLKPTTEEEEQNGQ